MKHVSIKEVSPDLYEISNFASYNKVKLYASREELDSLHFEIAKLRLYVLDENFACYAQAVSDMKDMGVRW